MKAERTVLFADYTVAPPPPGAQEACRQNALSAAGRVARGGSLPGQIKTQLSYIGVWFWLGLAALLGLALYVMGQIQVASLAGGMESLTPTLALFGSAGPVMAALAAPVLARSQTHDMWELEEAAYHNLPRLTTLRLLLCVLAALPVMLVLLFAGASSTGLLNGAAALIAPFLIASAANYLILGRLRGYAGSLCCVGVCLVVALLFSLPFWGAGFGLLLPADPGAVFPALLLAASVLLFVLCMRRYIRSSPAEV